YHGQTFYYNTSLLNPGDSMQIALQSNTTGFATGRYNYSITSTPAGQTATVSTGSVNILNYKNNAFGAGWNLANLERIYSVTGGVILDLGNGVSLWFAKTGSTFTTPAGDWSTLTQDGTTLVYTRTMPDGTKIT